MSSKFSEDLEKRLGDVEYAKAFGAEAAKTDLAFTITLSRRNYGITQTDLANRIGTSQAYVAKLERGDANPTIASVGALLAVIGARLLTSTAPLLEGGRKNQMIDELGDCSTLIRSQRKQKSAYLHLREPELIAV